jgi:hypothetical protein
MLAGETLQQAGYFRQRWTQVLTTTRNCLAAVLAVWPFGNEFAWSVKLTLHSEEPAVGGLVSWNMTS